MKKILSSILAMLLLLTMACCSNPKTGSNEISFTSQGTTKKYEISSSTYQWGNDYLGCGTFFDMGITEQPSTDLFSFVIKCIQTPDELKEGSDITDSVIRYSMYPFGQDGVAQSKRGSIVVIKKTEDAITVKFNNFKFTLDNSEEQFELNGKITYKLS